ncbi:RtcB family protein [Fusobacterium ulcerans]|uniref:RtcB family protein n=1 Tax=Fusobacterium ulcerans TaxID=861 RepID=UPI001D09C821|nr:RtcB family protein [Fusobacterium ulcerans]MCB8566720.1 RtcB family protein [Fusobacterium ulcerans]MCB8650911.1 RtcB family protein [Fusobacterium ulcerans]
MRTKFYEITGKYNTAKVFTNVIENEAVEQIKTLCNQEFITGSKIRIMPDVHSGAGCTIGTTMTITDKVIPNLVGVDIGCGMETVMITDKEIDLEKLDKLIYEKIPSGHNIRKIPHELINEIDLNQLRCTGHVKMDRAIRSIGTLGGGNHFIEAGKDEEGNIYITVHSGSRHLGLEVANYYQKMGYKALNKVSDIDIEKIIEQLKSEGREKEINKTIKEIKKQIITDIPQALAYVSEELFDDYIHDMKLIQKFAVLNRKAMMDEIIKGLGTEVAEEFTTIHNYIDTDMMILRKGAVSAKKGEKLLIPINMRDGSLICLGKGNEDWNYSAPHGAGRLMSRTKAKKTFELKNFKKEMEGIYTTSVSKDTLDECPMAYKAMEDIIKNIGDTVDIIKRIIPIYNFKAGE